MKIFYSPYELKYRFFKGSRFGSLICCQFNDGTKGYADVHPWVELGDLPLKKQLDLIRKEKTTNLTKRSLHFAFLDARFRKMDKSVFTDVFIPKSHYLLLNVDEDIPCEASAIKIKLGISPDIELSKLDDFFNKISLSVKIRIDFNNRIDLTTLEKYLSKIQPWKKMIDFIEDPCRFDQKIWSYLKKKYSISLAGDIDSEKLISDENLNILVLKPAVQDDHLFLQTGKRVVVTSYLDHPLGQLGSAYIASKFNETAGLLSHLNYQTNEFSEQLGVNDNVLVPPKKGIGFGFDDILEKQKWIQLT